MPLTIAFTGHRPLRRVPTFYRLTPRNTKVLLHLVTSYIAHHEPDHIITGMALGFDQIVARAADACGTPFTAAIPFPGQHLNWTEKQQGHYEWLLHKAKEIITVSKEPYRPELMQIRNEWMVNRADRIGALYDGSAKGGTYNALTYAHSLHKPIDNLWPDFAQYGQIGH